MRSILIIVLGTFFTGCIGVSTIVSEHKTVPFNPELKKGTIYGNSKSYSKEEVEALWGVPDDKIVSKDNKEGWIYKNRMSWGGIIIWVGLPLPLTLPTGFRSTTVFFENNLTKNADYEYARTPTAMCSLIPMMWLVHGSTNSWCHVFKE